MYFVITTITALCSSVYGHYVPPAPGTEAVPLIPEGSKGIKLNHILPLKWQEFCTAEYRIVLGEHFTSAEALFISCDLKIEDDWLLKDYRNWISSNENLIYEYLPMKTNLKVAVSLICRNIESKVSLPWPMLAEHLWYISAVHCTIIDHFSEYDKVHNVDNILKVIDIRDCIRQVEFTKMMEYMSNYLNQSKEFDCGGINVEKHVYRNITPTFIEPEPVASFVGFEAFGVSDTIQRNNSSFEDYDVSTMPHRSVKSVVNKPSVSEELLIHNFAQIGQANQKIESQCVFRYLKFIDKSHSYAVSKHNGHFMVERKRYPVLEFFNMSHSKLIEISPMLLQWRRYFPKMKHVDLSHNHIQYFKSFSDNGLYGDEPGVLDLRHNNITALTPDDIKTLKYHSRTVFIDIRDNPYVCDCKLEHLLPVLRNITSDVGLKYKYLLNLRCSNPQKHRGKIIAELEEGFCETLAIVILSAPFIILTCVCVFLFLALMLSVRYRKEIVILAFTRLHISLPCRHVSKEVSKQYDAFIAYSEHDSSWVFKALLPRLEEPSETNGPGLKLCIHHRDFPVGSCIADNILEKIADSHHTVLILSNNFLMSHWCKYEFKTAFTQSLMEKKQHLIMLLVEDLNKHLIDADLKRCLKTFTYVKKDDRLLWDKLIFALSDNRRKINVDINYNSCKKSVKSLKGFAAMTSSSQSRSAQTDGIQTPSQSTGSTVTESTNISVSMPLTQSVQNIGNSDKNFTSAAEVQLDNNKATIESPVTHNSKYNTSNTCQKKSSDQMQKTMTAILSDESENKERTNKQTKVCNETISKMDEGNNVFCLLDECMKDFNNLTQNKETDICSGNRMETCEDICKNVFSKVDKNIDGSSKETQVVELQNCLRKRIESCDDNMCTCVQERNHDMENTVNQGSEGVNNDNMCTCVRENNQEMENTVNQGSEGVNNHNVSNVAADGHSGLYKNLREMGNIMVDSDPNIKPISNILDEENTSDETCLKDENVCAEDKLPGQTVLKTEHYVTFSNDNDLNASCVPYETDLGVI